VRRRATAVAVLALTACRSAPMALHGTFAYPKPDLATCSAPKGGEALDVIVRDQLGAAFPGASVYVAPLSAPGASSSPPVWSAYTDEAGRATILLRASGVFSITAALGGFLASVRTVALNEGCIGTVALVLRLPDPEREH
jgi:hypothetical protein